MVATLIKISYSLETVNGNMTILYDVSGKKHGQISPDGNYGYLGGVVTKDGALEGMYEFEGELGNNIFENPSDPFLEVTTHEKEIDLAELFFTSRINFDDFEKIKGIVIFENGNQLQSIIEDPNRNSFIRNNLIPFRQYCYKIAYLDDEDRTVAESEEYCFSF